jgi:predicted rRNA methylase YqxC with S4 and FtsJ domains
MPPKTRRRALIHKQNQIERKRRSQNRIAAKKIYLDLHRVTHPAKDVDIVPTFLGVAPRGG